MFENLNDIIILYNEKIMHPNNDKTTTSTISSSPSSSKNSTKKIYINSKYRHKKTLRNNY